MSYSTASFDTGRFDRSAGVPQLDQSRGPDLTASNEMLDFAKGLDGLTQSGANMAIQQKNAEARAATKKRVLATAAKQEKTRKENEARIKAELYYNKYGGSKDWSQLTEAERAEATDVGVSSEGVVQTTQGDSVDPSSTPKTFSKMDADDKFLKEAYQLKRVDSLLVKHQENWNVVAPNLVDKVFDEWKLQKNDQDGITDFVAYATLKLEDYKTERFNTHYQGLDPNILGKALDARKPNDDIYLSAAAKKQEEYIDELQDRNIQAGIDNNKKYDMSTPQGLDALVGEIYLADDGTNKMKVYDRDRVQLQLIEHLDREVDSTTDPNHPVFETIKAFRGENSKQGRAFFDRRGVGKEWEAWVKKAVKKQNTLRSNAKTADKARRTQEKEISKERANRRQIVSSSALNYKRPTEAEIRQAKNGGTEVPLKRIEVLSSALRQLRKSEGENGYFAKGDKPADFIKLEQDLVKAIRAENPNHKEFVPDANKQEEARVAFTAQVSRMTKSQVEELRATLAETPKLKWVYDLQETIMDERETEISESNQDKKAALAITNAKVKAEEDELKKRSTSETLRIKNELTGGKTETFGKKKFQRPHSKDELIKLSQSLAKNNSLTDADKIKLTDEIKPLIKELQKKEKIVDDGKKYATFFKELTTLESTSPGGFPSVKDIAKLEEKINSRVWTDTAKQNQLTGLLAAHKKGKAEFLRKRAEVKEENKYSTKMSTLLSPVKTELQGFAAQVATKKLTSEAAVTKYEDLKRRFETDNAEFIAKGENFDNKIDHIGDFEEGLKNILKERTELEILDAQKKLEKSAKLNGEKRQDKVATILKEHTELLADKEMLLDPSKVSELAKKIRTASMDEVFDNGNKIPSNLFTPDEAEKYIKQLQGKVIEASDPTKVVSKQEVLVKSYKNIEDIKKLSGQPKRDKIEKSKMYLLDQLIVGDLDIGNFRIEQNALEEIEKDGEISTKPAYRAGEDAIRLVFAQRLDKYLNNEKYLPAREGTKLLNELTQKFNKLWAAEGGKLESATKAERIDRAYEIANSLTKVYGNPKEHPIDEDTNRRLNEFNMPRKELRKLVRGRNRTTIPTDSPDTGTKPKTNVIDTPSSFEMELEDDLEDTIDIQSATEDPDSISQNGPINNYGLSVLGQYDFYRHTAVALVN